MILPFTVEQSLDVFFTHNAAMWPAQVVAYALAGLIGAGILGIIHLVVRARPATRGDV